MDTGDCPCEDMREQLRSKIGEKQMKLRDLQDRQASMKRAFANWDRVGNDGALCRLLE